MAASAAAMAAVGNMRLLHDMGVRKARKSAGNCMYSPSYIVRKYDIIVVTPVVYNQKIRQRFG